VRMTIVLLTVLSQDAEAVTTATQLRSVHQVSATRQNSLLKLLCLFFIFFWPFRSREQINPMSLVTVLNNKRESKLSAQHRSRLHDWIVHTDFSTPAQRLLVSVFFVIYCSIFTHKQ